MLSADLEKISGEIIKLHRALFEESPSPMKLQKLCYYSQGIYLADRGTELFSDDFEAWVYGPVVRDLYQKYKHCGWKAIDDEIEVEGLDEAKVEFITMIVQSYGRFDGASLSTMTHREDPWVNARGGIPDTEGSNAVVTKASMEAYFKKQLQ